MSRTVFYAWQSDTDESVNHRFIAEALKRAIAWLNVDLQVQESEGELKFDRDTRGEPGMPPIADTILRKIRDAVVERYQLIAGKSDCVAIRSPYREGLGEPRPRHYECPAITEPKLLPRFSHHGLQVH